MLRTTAITREAETTYTISNIRERVLDLVSSATGKHVRTPIKESDLSAALGDLLGNPIEKTGGGYWNHAQEVKDAYPGLIRSKNTLSGSLNNPNLATDVRTFI